MNNLVRLDAQKLATLLNLAGVLMLDLVLGVNPRLFHAEIPASTNDMQNLQPLSTVNPEYPAKAVARNIQGWVQVQFAIDEKGAVVQDSVVVVDAEPPRLFNESAQRAVQQFKFPPKIIDGIAYSVTGVQCVFRYVLEGNQYSNQGLHLDSSVPM